MSRVPSTTSSSFTFSFPSLPQMTPTITRGAILKAQHPALTPQEQELVDFSEKIVDLVFVCDNTGSMSGEINVAKDTIQTIISSLHDHFKSDLRFSAVSYRDHSDDHAVKEYPFTRDVSVAKSYIQEMSAIGGGDYPEALASALKVVSEMPFNKNGKKIVIWIADAPPHGMGASGDSYPEGCKDENNQVIDWIKLADYVMEKGSTIDLIYGLFGYENQWKILLLTNANKIPNLIINGCIEDDEMDQLIAEKIKELGVERVKTMKQDELLEQMNKLTENAKVQQVQTFGFTSNRTSDLMKCNSMSTVPTHLFTTATSSCARVGNTDATTFSYGSTIAAKPSTEQVFKACQRNAATKR
ncbi:hypothetical protein C9374_013702 [Naegleria lovaniensis]|uniref:VWFA domain-containing protein n=1 Tax=Naegleria lovaniensis TaxID=51637 RepID=A0AA88GBN5_NAELO|nr:uncharacterized protein C9374_013702 [Naegleria lovaniensis]KAG2372638.1 hypothetical protein C9374_013702 [Naegleria lovaniensis]